MESAFHEVLPPDLLGSLVRHTECDVVDSSTRHQAVRSGRIGDDVDNVPGTAVACFESGASGSLVRDAQAEILREHAKCVFGVRDGEYGRVLAADRVFGGDKGRIPRVAGVGRGGCHKVELESVRITQREPFLICGCTGDGGVHTEVAEVVLPPTQAALRNRERSGGRLAGTDPPGDHLTPREEGHERARPPGVVAVVQVVGRWIVEVDGLLDKSETETADIEVNVGLRVSCDGGDVMQTRGVRCHGDPPEVRPAPAVDVIHANACTAQVIPSPGYLLTGGYPVGMDEALRSAVAEAVGGHVTALPEIRRTPLEYDAFLAHRSVNRLHGFAAVGDEDVRWSLIEKHTGGPDLASPYLLDNGRREFEAYRSGVLEDLAPGIRAPRVYGRLLDQTGGRTLWLEEIRHEGARPLDGEAILAAARNLGGMAGHWMGRELREPWYFTGWIDRHSQPEAVDAGLATLRRRHPAAVTRLGDRLALIEQLVLNQTRYREILESLPHTLCHHDAVGANIFHTGTRTVLIDWESIGPGPVGADLASLVFSSVRRGDALAGVVLPLVDDALAAYTDAVRAERQGISIEDVRLGFHAAIGLRWKLAVDVVSGLEGGEPPRRGSLPEENPAAAQDELILLVDLLLASAGRALNSAP